jgi:hypothetical protein
MEHQIYRNHNKNSFEINLNISRTVVQGSCPERGGDGGERSEHVGAGEDDEQAHPSATLSTEGAWRQRRSSYDVKRSWVEVTARTSQRRMPY